jgi:tetratricopeptide (TPR) repeat protein
MLLPLAVDEVIGRLPASGAAAARRVLAVALLLAGALGLWEAATGRFFVRWEQDVRSGLGAHPRWPGRRAARFLRDHTVEGPIFHNGVLAGAILMENGARLTPFLDARWAGTPGTMHAYQQVRGATTETIAQAWEPLARARGFEAVMLDFYEMPELLRWLAQAPGWGIVHHDETAIVFCRRGGRNQRVLDEAGPSIERGRAVPDPVRTERLARGVLGALSGGGAPPFARVAFPYGPLFRGNLAVRLGWVDDAQAAYLELLETERGALPLYPRRLGLWKNLLWSLEASDEPEAIAALAGQVAEAPGLAPAQRALIRLRRARALDQLGREDEAMDLARAVAEDAAAGEYLRWTAWCRVANLHAEARAYPSALDALRRAVQLQPQSADTYRSMGFLLDRELARPAEALAAYETYLALGGADPEIAERVRRLRAAPRVPNGAAAPR